MGKHGNKRDKHGKKNSSRSADNRRSGRSSSRRYLIWIIAVFGIIAFAAVWSVLNNKSHKIAALSAADKPQQVVPPSKPDTGVSIIKPDPVPLAPRLEIPKPEFDFGFVPQNAKVSHDFWLYSTGTDTLRILQVNPG